MISPFSPRMDENFFAPGPFGASFITLWNFCKNCVNIIIQARAAQPEGARRLR